MLYVSDSQVHMEAEGQCVTVKGVYTERFVKLNSGDCLNPPFTPK